jgi:hypothetical protein
MNNKSAEQLEEFIPTLTHAIERDIDLLLVEELKCDFEFVDWVISQLPVKSHSFSSVRVLHSKPRTFERREIDIHVEIIDFGVTKKKLTLLIENKINEKEQPGQAISYKYEINLLVRERRSDFAFSILVCPQAYTVTWPKFIAQFDAAISYESIEEFFRRRSKTLHGELKARLEHRAEMLSQAITKQRRGYKPIPIPKIGNFNAQYLILLNEMAPDIVPGRGLKRQSDKPSDSVSMIYDTNKSFVGLPKEIIPTRFAHELGRGKAHRANYVNVQFRGFDRGFNRLSAQDRKSIEGDGIVIEIKLDRRSGKKILKLKIPTPAVDNQARFDKSKSEIRKGIQSANTLRQWCFNRVSLLTQISLLSNT